MLEVMGSWLGRSESFRVVAGRARACVPLAWIGGFGGLARAGSRRNVETSPKIPEFPLRVLPPSENISNQHHHLDLFAAS
mmetsp:Transcript_21419/g.31798  ORF Transcript_21419/g.31798 Transcript_21419/m.31798 type:complete len:80 (+) Transcript_21419:1253-1492(+)